MQNLLPVVVDFETYYDPASGYSLSKMNTEQYVRDPRFQIIGVGLTWAKKQAWITGTKDHIKAQLLKLPWDRVFSLSHNTSFDGFILEDFLGISPYMYGDTLSMARPVHGTNVGGSLDRLSAYYGIGVKGKEVLDAKGKRLEDFTPEELAQYGRYCVNDCVLTGKLFHKLKPHFSATELRVIDMTIKMAVRPRLRINVPLLEGALADLQAQQQRELVEIADLMNVPGFTEEERADGARKVLSSNPKFAEFLESRGVEVPMKPSPSNPEKMTYAFAKTDPGLLELRESDDPLVVSAIEQRMAVKSTIRATRMATFIEVGKRGAIPWPLRYAGAHTNRWSGDWGWNMQNPPKHRDAKAGLREPLRDALGAPPGYVIVAFDSSQIEARVNAWLWGQKDLIELFATGGDPYCAFATTAYGRLITKADITERFVGKGCVLGLGFGMGPPKLKTTLKRPIGGISVDIPLEEAERLVSIYRVTNDKIAAGWKDCQRAIRAMHEGATYTFGVDGQVTATQGQLRLPSGNVLRYPDLQAEPGQFGKQYTYIDREGKKRKYIYGAKTDENIVQSIARDIIAWQGLQIMDRGWPIVGNTHDELISCAPEDQQGQCYDDMESCMKLVPHWAKGCPVSCEGAIARRYGDC